MCSLLLFCALGSAQTKAPARASSKTEVKPTLDFTKAQPQPISATGRYQIFFSPNVRADTFLVDTSTGRIWRMAEFSDISMKPTAWVMEDRLDSNEELSAWLNMKQQTAALYESPKATSVH